MRKMFSSRKRTQRPSSATGSTLGRRVGSAPFWPSGSPSVVFPPVQGRSFPGRRIVRRGEVTLAEETWKKKDAAGFNAATRHTSKITACRKWVSKLKDGILAETPKAPTWPGAICSTLTGVPTLKDVAEAAGKDSHQGNRRGEPHNNQTDTNQQENGGKASDRAVEKVMAGVDLDTQTNGLRLVGKHEKDAIKEWKAGETRNTVREIVEGECGAIDIWGQQDEIKVANAESFRNLWIDAHEHVLVDNLAAIARPDEDGTRASTQKILSAIGIRHGTDRYSNAQGKQGASRSEGAEQEMLDKQM